MFIASLNKTNLLKLEQHYFYQQNKNDWFSSAEITVASLMIYVILRMHLKTCYINNPGSHKFLFLGILKNKIIYTKLGNVTISQDALSHALVTIYTPRFQAWQFVPESCGSPVMVHDHMGHMRARRVCLQNYEMSC